MSRTHIFTAALLTAAFSGQSMAEGIHSFSQAKTAGAKVNADAITHANDARMEAAKVGLATSAQRVASAWAMVSADARVSDSTNTQINL